jgi:predicted transposase YbfD/YdcC
MVSAFSTDLGLALGQEKTAADSNEITAVPALLEKLMLKGCIVTLDAMGCQREIAAKIKERGGDYLLALKGNQGELHEAVRDHFDAAIKEEFRGFPHDFLQTVDKGHGRIETRTCWVVKDVGWLPRVGDWPGLNMIGMVEAKREIGERTTVERRYYIGTIGENAKLFAKTVRDHWAIENSLHWVLDVAFREDESRIRLKNAAANMAVLRHMTVNVLRSEKGSKRGIKVKRSKAGWDESYLLKLIGLTGL